MRGLGERDRDRERKTDEKEIQERGEGERLDLQFLQLFGCFIAHELYHGFQSGDTPLLQRCQDCHHTIKVIQSLQMAGKLKISSIQLHSLPKTLCCDQ
jgi:hypothetical protein